MKRIATTRKHLLAVMLLIAVSVPFGCGRDEGDAGSDSELERELELLTILSGAKDSRGAGVGRGRQVGGGDAARANREQERKREKLGSLPYLQGYHKATTKKNVTVFDRDRAGDGINVYTSGHEPAAYVIDMEGRVLHEWKMKLDKVWPDVPYTVHSTFWRRVHAYPDGGLLAVFEGIGLIRLDRESRLVWSFRGGCHHEATVAADGTIFVLTREAMILPRLNPDDPVLIDGIAQLSPDGKLLAEYSILKCFENSEYAGLLDRMPRKGDLFHTNTIHLFDGSLESIRPYYRKGNVLISSRKLNIVAIVNLDEEKVVWAHDGGAGGLWKRQHDPTVLPDGHMLLFDNRSLGVRSRVIEFDPRTFEIVWRYPRKGETGLSSKTCGTSRRLANGNTLITESDNGRALEVTRGGEIVWEFYNPHRTGKKNELVATLFEVTRLPSGYFPWLATR